MRRILYLLTLVGVGSIVGVMTGCPSEPGLPQNPRTTWRFFPYVQWAGSYVSVISLVNRDETYAMDVVARFRDASGATVATETKRLGPKDVHRIWRANFTGSVELKATGEWSALVACQETRAGGIQGVGLTQSATPLDGWGPPWCYQLGARDEGPGNARTTVVTANVRSDTSIYVKHSALALSFCAEMFEVKLSPFQVHTYGPYDQYTQLVGQGATEFAVFACAHTGSNYSGSPVTEFTGAVFAETAGDIGMANVTSVNREYWNMGDPGSTQPNHLYFADVQDDGVNRRDRLFIKSNENNNYPIQEVYAIHFYDQSGTEVATVHPPLVLTDQFDEAGSYEMIAPMDDFVDGPFKGSVCVESPHPLLQGAIRREAPGLWSDMNLASPAGSLVRGCIPYVTSKESGWASQLVLFFPKSIHPVPEPVVGQPQPPSFVYGGPTDTIPPAEDGVVVLKFRDMTGNLTGWAAIYIAPNETKYLRINDIAVNYFTSHIEGSVEFTPHVVCVLQTWHEDGRCHASMGNWLSGQS